MAIYHAQIKNFSRGKGESATAAAAYRAGIDIADTRLRTLHAYSHRSGVVSHHMLAPAGAPSWCNNAATFFDAAEAWESRANAIVGRELEVSLPAELSESERQTLALSLGQLLVDRYRVVALVAIHLPSENGDQRNHHVHILMSSRQVGPEGFGPRAAAEFDARKGQGAEEIRIVRALVAEKVNQALESAGKHARVDHRSLREQAREAFSVGDIEKGRALSRPPTRHIGKALTAALRRGLGDPLLQKAGITASVAQRTMEQAEAEFVRQGRLVATPESQGWAAAREERGREQAKIEPKEPNARSTVRPPGGISPAAFLLGRLGRLGKTQGVDAALLNAESKLIEEWLAAQEEVARAALESLGSIPGLRFEPAFSAAIETARRRRVSIYGTKTFFFEDAEVLSGAIEEYASALCQPHRDRIALHRAQWALSECEEAGPGGAARVQVARRALAKAKERVSRAALLASERRIDEARAVMVAATEAMERDYYVTPLDRVKTSPPESYLDGFEGSERKSDSNRVQLNPRARPQA